MQRSACASLSSKRVQRPWTHAPVGGFFPGLPAALGSSVFEKGRDAICEAKASESDADWPRRRLILSFHWRRCESLFVHLAGACLEAFGRLPESHPSESTFAPRRITRSDFIYWLSSRVIGIAREDGGKDDDHIIFCISNIHGIRQVSNLALATAWYRIVAYFVDTLKLWKSRYFFGRRITNFYFWSISSFWVTPCLFEFTTCLTLHFFLTYRTTQRNSVKDG